MSKQTTAKTKRKGKTPTEKLANRIARYLFTSARRKRAWLMHQYDKDGNRMSGWCEEAVSAEIQRMMTKAKVRL